MLTLVGLPDGFLHQAVELIASIDNQTDVQQVVSPAINRRLLIQRTRPALSSAILARIVKPVQSWL